MSFHWRRVADMRCPLHERPVQLQFAPLHHSERGKPVAVVRTDPGGREWVRSAVLFRPASRGYCISEVHCYPQSPLMLLLCGGQPS